MMKYPAFGLCLLLAGTALAQQDRPSPLDGTWTGRSDGGSCNAPLDYQLTIETGIVDGSAYDTRARGPVPNTKKGPPPPPTPGLWQIHGLAKPGTFSLMAVASVKGTDRRGNRLTVTAQGNTLTVTESGGCGRVARLAKG
jgi:hypothetical protein